MDPPPRLTICLAGCRPRPPHPGQLSITYPSDWPPVPHCPPCPGTFKLPTPHNWQMVTWISMKGLWQTVFNRPQTDERVSLTMLFILTMIFDSQRRANCPNFREASLAFPALPHSVAPIHLALGGTRHDSLLNASNLPFSNAYIPVKGPPTTLMHELLVTKLCWGHKLHTLPTMHPSTHGCMYVEHICTRPQNHVCLLCQNIYGFQSRFMGKSFAQRFRRHRYFLVWAEDKSWQIFERCKWEIQVRTLDGRGALTNVSLASCSGSVLFI